MSAPRWGAAAIAYRPAFDPSRSDWANNYADRLAGRRPWPYAWDRDTGRFVQLDAEEGPNR